MVVFVGVVNNAMRHLCRTRALWHASFGIKLACLLGATGSLFGFQSADMPGDHPREAADILMIPAKSTGSGLYLLDSSARAIYFHPTPAATSDSVLQDVPFAEFTLFAVLRDLRKPSTFAYREGKLYVADPETAMVKSVDIGTGQIGDLETDDVLRRPTAIAVSESGEIAIADQRSHSILRILTTGERTITRYSGLEDPIRLAYDRSNLLILDKRSGRQSLYVTTAGSGKLTARPPASAEMNDFALQRGVFYIAVPDQVAVYSPDTTLLKINFTHADRVSAVDEALAILSRSGKFVRVLPRLVPVQATLEGTADGNNRGLVRLYEYLYERRLLATYPVSTPPNFSSLQAILLSEWILLPSVHAPKTDKLEMDLDTKRRFQKIVCGLNRSLCSSKTDPAKLLEHRIVPGAVLTMPEVYVADARHQAEVKPGPARGHSAESMGTLKQGPQAAQQYSLTAELERLSFIGAVPPNPAIQPGTFVRLDGGRARIAVRPSLCWSGAGLPQPVGKPASLIANLALPTASESLPLTLTQSTSLRDPKRLGIVQIGATFEDVERRDLEIDAVLASQAAAGKCLSAHADPNPLLVTEVLTAASARYRLRVASSSLLPRAIKTLESELAGRDVSLTVLPDGIELTVRQPLALGFKAVQVQAGAGGKLSVSAPLNPRSLVGGTPSGGQRGGVAPPKCPWLLTFLAPSRELNDVSSSLRKLEEDNEDMYIWSSE
jgi:hypothetical protein